MRRWVRVEIPRLRCGRCTRAFAVGDSMCLAGQAELRRCEDCGRTGARPAVAIRAAARSRREATHRVTTRESCAALRWEGGRGRGVEGWGRSLRRRQVCLRSPSCGATVQRLSRDIVMVMTNIGLLALDTSAASSPDWRWRTATTWSSAILADRKACPRLWPSSDRKRERERPSTRRRPGTSSW